MLVHGLSAWSKFDSHNDGNSSTDHTLTPAIGSATSKGSDYLSALPQELHDEICQYLGPPDLVSLKLCSRTLLCCTRASFNDLKVLAQESCTNEGGYFRAAAYLEYAKGEYLLCALCGWVHRRNAFVPQMANQPGSSRFCRKYLDCTLEFGLSGMSWKTLIDYIAALEEEHRTPSNMATGEMAQLYAGAAIMPEIHFPFQHTVHAFSSVVYSRTISGYGNHYRRAVNEITGQAKVTQRLRFRRNNVILASKIAIGPQQCRDVHLACLNASSDPMATTVRFSMPDEGLWLCRDVKFDGEELHEILRELCSAAARNMVDRYKATCTFCQARTILSSEANGFMTIETERDLGPCKDEKDPLWLRHVSKRKYHNPMINRMLNYAKATGEDVWEGMEGTSVWDLPALSQRSSWRLKGGTDEYGNTCAGSSWNHGKDDD